LSGGIDSLDEGQLAVFDAVVFFAGAILISSVILALPGHQTISNESCWNSVRAAELLDGLLSSSIGTNITIGLELPVIVPSRTSIRDCLAVEGAYLFTGGESDGFGPLNSIIMGLLEDCAPPFLDAHLMLVYRSFSEPLLALPHAPDDMSKRTATSTTMTLEDGSELLVVLVLCPSSPSELVQLRGADLHLLPGVPLPSKEVDV
jgi:hypothetical protein